MTLNRHSSYSIARSYVLRRDARPDHDKVIGRLEHMASGRRHPAGCPIEMDITDGQVFRIESRISACWHDGSLVSTRYLSH